MRGKPRPAALFDSVSWFPRTPYHNVVDSIRIIRYELRCHMDRKGPLCGLHASYRNRSGVLVPAVRVVAFDLADKVVAEKLAGIVRRIQEVRSEETPIPGRRLLRERDSDERRVRQQPLDRLSCRPSLTASGRGTPFCAAERRAPC